MTPQREYEKRHNLVDFSIIIEKEYRDNIRNWCIENNISFRTWLIQKIKEELEHEEN